MSWSSMMARIDASRPYFGMDLGMDLGMDRSSMDLSSALALRYMIMGVDDCYSWLIGCPIDERIIYRIV